MTAKKKKHKLRNLVAYSLVIRTGGAGKHQDGRLRRKRTRHAAKQDAIKESSQ